MRILIFFLMVGISSSIFAGDKHAEHQEWMKKAMQKETQRAEDSVKHHSNTERFEHKFGWIKEKQPQKFKDLMAANKKAAQAWSDVLKKAGSTTNPEDLTELKARAHAAAGDAYLAEIGLKFSGAADGRKDMLKKHGTPELEGLTAKLNRNEASMLDAHKARHQASMALEKLENENRALNSALKQSLEKSRSKR